MVALVDDEDIDRLNQFNWTVTLSCKRYLYVTTKIENGERKELVSLQQFILNKEIGDSPFNKYLKEYFQNRDIKEFDRNNVAYRQKLAKKQKYKCPLCSRSI